jgi:hypothetical protein
MVRQLESSNLPFANQKSPVLAKSPSGPAGLAEVKIAGWIVGVAEAELPPNRRCGKGKSRKEQVAAREHRHENLMCGWSQELRLLF